VREAVGGAHRRSQTTRSARIFSIAAGS
jgi:hypothetical protein